MRGRKPEKILSVTKVHDLAAPPAWFSKDARAEWSRTVPILNERRIMTAGDLASFENYCVAVGQVREMQRIIVKQGHIIETARGPRAHPAVKIQADAMTRARLLAAELGLTPVSRSRPSIREDNDDPDASDLGL